MLETLVIDDLALIEHAEIEPDSGLTVISGETGSGKTVLLGALKLLLGARSDSSLIRKGATESKIQAQIDGHILRRQISAKGSSRCYIDGDLHTVKDLAATTDHLIELSGQHEHQTLLRTRTHLDLLDVDSSNYRQAYDIYQDAAKTLQEARSFAEHLAEAQAQATYIDTTIGALDPNPGQYEEQKALLPKLAAGESLLKGASLACQALSSAGDGVDDPLSTALAALSPALGADPTYDQIYQDLLDLQEGTQNVLRSLRAYQEDADFDEAALDAAQEWVFTFERLLRQFGPTPDDVFTAWQKAQDDLHNAAHVDDRLAAAEAACATAEAALREAAQTLAKQREAAAKDFCKSLQDDVGDLAMPEASFTFKITPLPFAQWTNTASCTYELLYRPSTDADFLPFAKIASGGELSRILLAIKSLGAKQKSAETLVFDEIDAGVGGRCALAIAKRLRNLARTHQVIVVSHLPQIAAAADRQYVVEKDGKSRVHEVCGDARIAELARMLSGQADPISCQHAQKMLAEYAD
ncbi:MAG: AAA family ATPase [Coriobacteriales bacterium]|jgi:DNA repair protein RecN (Recombination protein N)|nr:AAA family ATPase [Coriobacteriales bacterium]